ncbi:MAG: 30S ribosomal protein S7 [Candidatus Colwellbacteria bacterium CG10_big_fil_rev_8_21_14_0_10_41_28]|uniref:Small ribosomal subunit protein uS7 n=1 Tax=Candidatus Colwellbacteria bacterium CG10_big_fil_rev_8_21_14_0_10_41_28 TaxID=1974539 RepID=A0A2H0VJE2_9BACT|nr:MAG: 30S ribosomal protein S7 [Candidatus Colwellbacteria bacterium CG10_big_fil_rev_8_21_14_0_10_41_28]
MRKNRNYKRDHKPDAKYGSVTAARFINYIMKDGKKTIAEKVFYDALDEITKRTKQDGMEVFEKALENVTPKQEVFSKRVGGANYQIPRDVRPERQFILASRWILTAARSKKGKALAQILADELLAAYNNEGDAIKKKQDVHRMAEANRAFAHFAR